MTATSFEPSPMLKPVEDDRVDTARLVLRPPAYSDAPALRDLLNDPEVSRYSPHPLIADVAFVHLLIADWQERREEGLRTYVVTHRDRPREPIGLFNIAASGEVGGCVSPRHAGSGIAMEAVLALRAVVGLPEAWTVIDAEHAALIRFLEKAGYRIEQRLPAHRVHPQLSGNPRDCVLLRRRA